MSLYRDVLDAVASFLPAADRVSALRVWRCMRPLRGRFIEEELARGRAMCMHRVASAHTESRVRQHVRLFARLNARMRRITDRARLLAWLWEELELAGRDWSLADMATPNAQLAERFMCAHACVHTCRWTLS